MNNHQLLTRKAVKLPETAVEYSQALVGAECIIRMHHFVVLWPNFFFSKIFQKKIQKNFFFEKNKKKYLYLTYESKNL